MTPSTVAAEAQASRPDRGLGMLGRSAQPNHVVQFYESDQYLAEVVGDFLAAGLIAGEPAIVVATEAHRQSFASELVCRGVDVEGARASGQLTILDAAEMLGRLIVDGAPDEQRFQQHVGGLLASVEASRPGPIRVYGEMVDLLCREGNAAAAIRLEELWNRLGRSSHQFTLLCGYGMGSFGRAGDAQPLRAVCGAHSHVIPTESYARIAEDDARLREVAMLQQRARALETELEHRHQVERALRDALEQRDDFISAAGHELKTPLTAVRLHVESLRAVTRDSGDQRLRDRLSKTSENVSRLARLIDQLLDATSISAGRFELDLRPADLAAVVYAVIERMSDQLARSRCQVRVRATSGPVEGQWDPFRLEQVVSNLLSNAIKYGAGQTVEVTLGRENGRVRLAMRDHGIGISAEDRPRIFQRFERAVPTANYGGFGLGLWIVKQIVDAHGGTVSVESEPGAGATFTIELPVTPPGPALVAAVRSLASEEA